MALLNVGQRIRVHASCGAPEVLARVSRSFGRTVLSPFVAYVIGGEILLQEGGFRFFFSPMLKASVHSRATLEGGSTIDGRLWPLPMGVAVEFAIACLIVTISHLPMWATLVGALLALECWYRYLVAMPSRAPLLTKRLEEVVST